MESSSIVPLIVLETMLTDDRPVFFDLAQLIYEPALISVAPVAVCRARYSYATMPPRRFPPPWSAELQPNYYVVRDANKQQLAYVYFGDPGYR